MNDQNDTMTQEPTDRAANSALSASPGSVVLSGGLPMTRDDYERLKASGMMWEIFPKFTGDYDKDIISQNMKGTRCQPFGNDEHQRNSGNERTEK